MSATRTQIYLTDTLRERIDAVAAAEGISMTEVIRRALADYLPSADEALDVVLRDTFGAEPDIVPPDRDGWERG